MFCPWNWTECGCWCVPDGLADGAATVEVVNNNVRSDAAAEQVSGVSPGLFLVSGYAAARHLSDYRLVSKPELFAGCNDPVNCPARAMQPGEYILLYGTGFGPVGAGRLLTQPVRVEFAGGSWAEAAARRLPNCL